MAWQVRRVDVHCELLPIEDARAGGDEAAQRAWLLQRWRAKEEMLLRAAEGQGLVAKAGGAVDGGVPPARTMALQALAVAAIALLLVLLASSPSFRLYALLANVAAASVAHLDPPGIGG